MYYTRRVSGITFIRYAQNHNITKPHNWIVFGSNFKSQTAYTGEPESDKELCLCFSRNFLILSSFIKYNRICSLINTTDATSLASNAYPSGAPEFTLGFQWGSCYSIFSFMCMFCSSLFFLVSFFFWPLCCVFFFDLGILITPLVSSNSSYMM